VSERIVDLFEAVDAHTITASEVSILWRLRAIPAPDGRTATRIGSPVRKSVVAELSAC
jgi:hypothetical protein